MVKAILHGCNGKMGQVITGICAEDDTIEIVAGIDVYDGINNPYPVYQNIADCSVSADVVIDFSNAGAVDALLDYSMEKDPSCALHNRLVRSTAGKGTKDGRANGGIKIGEYVAWHQYADDLLKKAVHVLAPAGFDIEIVEKHHNQKLDAPSGTALALADCMNEELEQPYTYQYDRTKERRKRAKKEIGIAAVRGGNIVGEHEVIFAGTDEVITLKHTAYSKAVFAKGAVEAAKFLAGKGAGMYDMADVIAHA